MVFSWSYMKPYSNRSIHSSYSKKQFYDWEHIFGADCTIQSSAICTSTAHLSLRNKNEQILRVCFQLGMHWGRFDELVTNYVHSHWQKMADRKFSKVRKLTQSSNIVPIYHNREMIVYICLIWRFRTIRLCKFSK